MASALEHGRGNDERWHLRKDGTRFWASGEMMALRDDRDEVQGFIKVLRDRTAQRLDEEKRHADTEFMERVLYASDDCIKVLDLDGNLTFMSEGGKRVMEVDDFGKIAGCPWPDFWQQEGNASAKAAVASARAGTSARFIGKASTMAGNVRWWDVQVSPMFGADGKPDRILSVSRDISATRIAEEAATESERRLRLTLTAAGSATGTSICPAVIWNALISARRITDVLRMRRSPISAFSMLCIQTIGTGWKSP